MRISLLPWVGLVIFPTSWGPSLCDVWCVFFRTVLDILLIIFKVRLWDYWEVMAHFFHRNNASQLFQGSGICFMKQGDRDRHCSRVPMLCSSPDHRHLCMGLACAGARDVTLVCSRVGPALQSVMVLPSWHLALLWHFNNGLSTSSSGVSIRRSDSVAHSLPCSTLSRWRLWLRWGHLE